LRQNIRNIGWMILSMLGFALSDSVIKVLVRDVPTGQIILMVGTGGTAIFALLALRQKVRIFSRDFFAPAVLVRNMAEGLGTVLFVSALAAAPLITLSSIQQAGPLIVTLGAAVFLKEHVGPRRWTAVLIGLVGVLIILRPTSDELNAGALLGVSAVVMLSVRDLTTRIAPPNLHTLQLATWGFSMLIPAGALLLFTTSAPVALDLRISGLVAATIALTMLAYFAITASMRTGDLSVVSPFRYTRLIFALILGILFLGERPDSWTLIGAAIVILSGLYVFARERRKPL
jgi:drug/metabolite transporter (DMT)-like permease